MTLREQALALVHAGIDAVKPHKLLQNNLHLQAGRLSVKGYVYDLAEFENIYVIGGGKASAFMAKALEEILADYISEGLVVVKYAHRADTRQIAICEAGHPLPDENGLAATAKVLAIAQKATAKDLVICLISGGGSALLEALPPYIPLADLQKTSDLLLTCGATIQEFNTLRKHLSRVKGGGLAAAISPAACLTLIISDVIGDPVEAIASGPTSPDSTTFADAWEIICKYHLASQLPEPVLNHIQQGLSGALPETLTADAPVFQKVRNIILGNNLTALQAAQQAAQQQGFNTLMLSSRIQGEAREAATVIAAIVQEIIMTGIPVPPPACLIFGGETTVTLHGKGKGGRNQEFVLAALLAMASVHGDYLILSCGSDGTDGPTDAAGAMASPDILRAAQRAELSLQQYLNHNNAYHFFQKTGGLIITGPTGTNVMDIGIALLPALK